jgi:hypothetical protein
LRADEETLATQLISAAVTICAGDERGVDDEADFMGSAGVDRQLFRPGRSRGFKVGAWGIGMLRAVPIFKYDGEILSLPRGCAQQDLTEEEATALPMMLWIA